MPTSTEFFLSLGLHLCNRSNINGKQEQHRIFKAHFAVSPLVCLKAWGLICEYRKEFGKYPRNLREPKHLLWALYFIKVYNTNKCCETWADATDKTFRCRAWDILEQLSDIALLKVSKTFFEKNKIRTTYPTLLFLSNSNSNDFSFL